MQAMDVATDIAATVVNALADVTPEDAGKVAGFITEQIAEQVLIVLLTEGGGEGAAAAAFPARIAAILEKSKVGAAAIERLQPLIKALRELDGSEEIGKALAKIGEALRGGSKGEEAVEGAKGVMVFVEILDHCFAAGTPILTPSGEKSIELFEVGDEILTRPEDSPDAPLRTSAVEKVFRLSGLTLELRVGERVITTTEKHPFYVVGQGWTWAGELKPGDMILGHNGDSIAVQSIAPTGRYESLYNLRVAFDRTYFVGSQSWGFSLWVHNSYALIFDAEGKAVGVKSVINGVEKTLDTTEFLAKSGKATLEEAVNFENALLTKLDSLAAASEKIGKSGTLSRNQLKELEQNRKVDEYLLRKGETVELNPLEHVEGAGRQGDRFVNGLKTEYKSLGPNATANTVKNNVNNSIRNGGQARQIFLDARGSGLTEQEAIEGIRNAMRISRGKVDKIRIFGDGFDITN
jgi:hypothetical protein